MIAARAVLVSTALLFAVPLSVSCSASTTEPATTPKPFSPAYVATLRPKIEALLKDTLAPGAVVLVRSPELGDWTEAFGVRTLGGTEKVTIGDHWRIASVTKTWTGTVILQLVDEGKIALTDPVSKYRPDVPNGENITIEMLLNMRSGLFDFFETLAYLKAVDEAPLRVWAPDEGLKIAFAEKPYFEPGKGYRYSNTNTVLLGVIIEQVTKSKVEDEFKTRIFDKLGMNGSRFPARASNAIPAPYARGYMFGTMADLLDPNAVSAEKQAAAKAGTYKPLDVTDMNPSGAWTAGAGISMAEDLARFAKALGEGDLLSADMHAKQMASCVTPNPSDPAAPSYGWGLVKVGPMYGHNGALPGYNTNMLYDPVRKLTIVTWTSLLSAADGRLPGMELTNLIVAQLYGTADGGNP